MNVTVKRYEEKHLEQMIAIWNEVVEDGVAFPQTEPLDTETGAAFFADQTHTAVAVDQSERVIGLYILHPNNIGRCGHIGNASYAVASEYRGRHVGEKLVTDSLETGKDLGFSIMQFNAVVADNVHARHLYERLGFVPLGTIPKGFKMKDGHLEDICLYYREL